ncbi:MAG: hypothetical protein IJ306_04415 [Oscillospiraceae bacterium]|nr:hypothetical protein [Oscillospiraceae bacterium]
MKKLFALILALLMFCSCAVQEEQGIDDPIDNPQSETEVPEKDISELSDEEFIAAAKEMGYSDEQLGTIFALMEEGLTKKHVLRPLEMSALVPAAEKTDDGKYFLGMFFFDPEVYADYGGPIGFAYIRKDGVMEIIPEIPGQFSDYGIIDNEHYVFGGGNEVRFYEFENPKEPSAVWKVPEQENTEFGYWGLDLAVQKNVGKAFVCYVDMPDDFDKVYENQTPDLSATYQIAVLDSEGNLIRNINTGINLMVEFGGLPDCVRPEIITASETDVLFKINNLHYTANYSTEGSTAKQYIFSESDVVMYSNIDFTGDFAKSAVKAVTDYISENYSENKDTASFDIRIAEIDENATYKEINLTGGSVKGRHDTDDILNGFVVIRTITDINYADGTTKEEVFKYYLLFDPENKYDRGQIIANSGWRFIDGSKEMFDAPEFDDNRFYRYFEEGKILK